MKLRRFFAVFAIVTICSSTIYAQQAQVIDKIVAVVGNNIIMQSDIEEQYMQYRMQGGIKGSASSIRCEILEDMLFRKLMLNQAELDSITVSDEQIDSEVDRYIRYYLSQFGSQEKLEKYYDKPMKDIKNDLRDMLKEKQLMEEVQRKIVEGVNATPSDVREFYNNIPKDSIPMVSAQYEIAELVKKPPITLDEKLAVKERLYGLRSRILKGERFSTMALLYSEDPGSAKKGGELGFKGRGELVPEF